MEAKNNHYNICKQMTKLTEYSAKALSTVESDMDEETCINIAANGIRMLREGNVYLNYQRMLSCNTFHDRLASKTLIEMMLDSYRDTLGCDSLALLLMMIKAYVCRLPMAKWNPMNFAIAHKLLENECDKIREVSTKFFKMMVSEIGNNNFRKWMATNKA